jgi:hypothetical protein
MDIQNILDEVEALGNLPDSVTITSATEPTQAEWEVAWIAAGYELPIGVGTELLWNDGTNQRAVYMTTGDKFTIVVGISDLSSTDDPRVIRCLGWLDNDHLYGIGDWGTDSGTFKIYMDGSVEHICDEYAIANHYAAETLLVQDQSTKQLKTYNYDTDTLSAAIVTIVNWDQSVNYDYVRATWNDESTASDLSFYFSDGTTIYNYDGVSTIDTVSSGVDVHDMVVQNDLLVFTNTNVLYYLDTTDTWPTTYTTVRTEISTVFLRKTPGSSTLVDVGRGVDADNSWNLYRQFNTSTEQYQEIILEDTYAQIIRELSDEHNIIHNQDFADVDVDRLRWAAPLINDLTKQYTRMIVSPDQRRVFALWHETDAYWDATGNRELDSGTYYHIWSKSKQERRGAVVLSNSGECNEDCSTGRIYRITEWSDPEPDVMYLEGAQLSGTNKLIIDNLDQIPEEYDILKIDLHISPSGSTYLPIRLYEADDTEIAFYGTIFINTAGSDAGHTTSTLVWSSGVPIYFPANYGQLSITILNFHDMDNAYPLMIWFEGGFYDTSLGLMRGVGFVPATDISKILSYLVFDLSVPGATVTNFTSSVSALKTSAGYSKKDKNYNDYRMA